MEVSGARLASASAPASHPGKNYAVRSFNGPALPSLRRRGVCWGRRTQIGCRSCLEKVAGSMFARRTSGDVTISMWSILFLKEAKQLQGVRPPRNCFAHGCGHGQTDCSQARGRKDEARGRQTLLAARRAGENVSDAEMSCAGSFRSLVFFFFLQRSEGSFRMLTTASKVMPDVKVAGLIWGWPARGVKAEAEEEEASECITVIWMSPVARTTTSWSPTPTAISKK